jgi:hypothetical protein
MATTAQQAISMLTERVNRMESTNQAGVELTPELAESFANTGLPTKIGNHSVVCRIQNSHYLIAQLAA